MNPERSFRESWWVGAVLIILGVVFLLQNLGIQWVNWWALFLIGFGIYELVRAWSFQKATGSWGGRAFGALLSGVVWLVLGLIFIFNLSLGKWWPLLLIVMGAVYLLRPPGWRTRPPA
jgi:uncharacterized membrane protein